MNGFDCSKEYDDINDVLEFYNIQKYLNNKSYLTNWDEETINHYLEISKRFSGIISKYFSTLNEENILERYQKINNQYYDDFWELFDKYKMYEGISNKKIEDILNDVSHFHFILVHKRIVNIYDALL